MYKRKYATRYFPQVPWELRGPAMIGPHWLVVIRKATGCVWAWDSVRTYLLGPGSCSYSDQDPASTSARLLFFF